ncbi:MAG: TrmH family RNA methyltransferase [Actinomycetota bacterium]
MVLGNPKVQLLRLLLGRPSARAEEGVVAVEGETLIREALAAGWTLEVQFVASGAHPIPDAEPVHVLAPGVLERVVTTETPQPHVAIFECPAPRREMLETATFVVVAVDIADPGNLGTMMRSAEAAGADLMVVSPTTVDVFNPKVIRSSAGSVFRLPVVEVENLEQVRRAGRSIVASSSHRGTDYDHVDFRRSVAIVLGNEASGLDESVPVDEWVSIPRVGRAESLNVAMACTVLCFEIARQRRAASGTVDPR